MFLCPHERRWSVWRTSISEHGDVLESASSHSTFGPFDTVEDVGRWLAEAMLEGLTRLNYLADQPASTHGP